MNYSFSAKLHLTTTQHFNQVFKESKKLSGRYFALLVRANNRSYPRLGIMIAKRHVAKAVVRNRLRRVIKESFRLHQQLITGYDVLFIAYSGLDRITNQELRLSLMKQWETLSKLQEK